MRAPAQQILLAKHKSGLIKIPDGAVKLERQLEQLRVQLETEVEGMAVGSDVEDALVSLMHKSLPTVNHPEEVKTPTGSATSSAKHSAVALRQHSAESISSIKEITRVDLTQVKPPSSPHRGSTTLRSGKKPVKRMVKIISVEEAGRLERSEDGERA
ncbi:hypothetical protein CYMTET_14984 [Cymbomonas tetramitiformis]|uniref:Uncharacterized protein n=1 Tax=Cymbomonas tetramitiformis TaxID=36881 RepID=A0AAE0L9S9_9CHLO|nr:hypothetical protein CYMTET_14984 [Cymbomonas tetramitiformis]